MNSATPTEITQASFRIIQAELKALGFSTFDSHTAALIERIIHSTADFDFAEITRIAPGAIQAGTESLQAGCVVITDVNMVKVGISDKRLTQLGGKSYCFVAEAETRRRAEAEGTTRSAMGIRLAAEQGLLERSIVVVGNAPTALYEIIHQIGKGVRPALIIGVPVGFVSTVESKSALMEVSTVPWIVTVGRKGGSPVAVAIVNALLRLAADASATEVD